MSWNAIAMMAGPDLIAIFVSSGLTNVAGMSQEKLFDMSRSFEILRNMYFENSTLMTCQRHKNIFSYRIH